ncbi:hypothetical protein KY284_011360 [Solanum tuberosum]|nr:hypothetical protein KY284_011360 [Solanum tuberosum]
MVDKAKSLGDQPSMEDFYMFRAMVRNKGERCLTYVHEADRINAALLVGGHVLLREDEFLLKWTDEEASEDDQATGDIGSSSKGHTHQEFTPVASGMTYQPTNSEIVPYMKP